MKCQYCNAILKINFNKHEFKCKEYSENPNRCTNCSNPLPFEKRKSKFCSSSCSTSYNNGKRILSSETKNKISIGLKEFAKENPESFPRRVMSRNTNKNYILSCKSCQTTFNSSNKHTKTCSKQCRATICSKNRVVKVQIAFEEPLTKKSVMLQSNWEKLIAEHCNELGILWNRPTKYFPWIDADHKKHNYIPDFYLPKYDLFLDVKNPIGIAQQEYKISEVKKQINLVVMVLDDMKYFLSKLAH